MNRRVFVTGAVTAAQPVFGQSPNEQVSTAVIGVGNRAPSNKIDEALAILIQNR